MEAARTIDDEHASNAAAAPVLAQPSRRTLASQARSEVSTKVATTLNSWPSWRSRFVLPAVALSKSTFSKEARAASGSGSQSLPFSFFFLFLGAGTWNRPRFASRGGPLLAVFFLQAKLEIREILKIRAV